MAVYYESYNRDLLEQLTDTLNRHLAADECLDDTGLSELVNELVYHSDEYWLTDNLDDVAALEITQALEEFLASLENLGASLHTGDIYVMRDYILIKRTKS